MRTSKSVSVRISRKLIADFNWLRIFTAVRGSPGSLLTAFDAATASNYVETRHYESHTLLPACRFRREAGFDELLRPGHVPTVGDDTGGPYHCTYRQLYAIGLFCALVFDSAHRAIGSLRSAR